MLTKKPTLGAGIGVWLSAITAIGCQDDPALDLQSGDNVSVFIEDGLTPCGDLPGHMDHFIESLLTNWGIELEGERINFHWYSKASYSTHTVCRETTYGCADGFDSYSTMAPHDHELVHNVTQLLAVPTPFFTEGAAVVFDLPFSFTMDVSTVGDSDIHALLDTYRGSDLPAGEYGLAGGFTRFIIDRHGMERYVELYEALGIERDPIDIASIYAEVLGEELGDTVDDFDAERRGCSIGALRAKTFECDSPAILWDDHALRHSRTLACGEDGVIGPFHNDTARTYNSFDILRPGTFEINFKSDGPESTVVIRNCGGCEDEATTAWIKPEFENQPIHLPSGRYYILWVAPTASPQTLTLQLDRIPEQPLPP